MRDGRSLALVYLKGVLMGSADAVPGVSGGTIALITGIYERLIAAVTAVTPGRAKSLLAALATGDLAEARRIFRTVDGVFLLTLLAGIVTAVVTVTRLVALALEAIPVVTYGFFFGLIGASAVVLYGEVTLDTRGRVLAGVAGFVLAFVVSGRGSTALGTGLPVTALAGAVAVSAMILPGISGSLLLLILGQYEHLVTSLRVFVDGLVAGGATPGFPEAAVTVVAFVCGAFVGLFTVAHAVRRALALRREATVAFLVSLIVGALRAPVVQTGEKLQASGGAWTETTLAAFALAALVGGAAVLLAERAVQS